MLSPHIFVDDLLQETEALFLTKKVFFQSSEQILTVANVPSFSQS